MSYQDVRHFYEDPPDEHDQKEAEIKGLKDALKQLAGIDVEAITEERDLLREQVEKLLNHCDDAECMECSKIICPDAEPLHFHHDGCPVCYTK